MLEKLPPTREQNSYGVRPRRLEKEKKPSMAKFVNESPRTKRTQLKYGNLLKLAIILLLLNWLISLPFQARRRNPPEIKVSPSTTLQKKAPPAPPPPMPTDGFYYNVSNAPPWKADADLQTIVDEAVALAKTQGFPVEDLSISLVDVKNPDQHLHAGYKNQQLRFPASVVKLYWLVTFYGAVAKGMITNESKFDEQLRQMMAISSNDAASRVLDAVTGTKSGKRLAAKE
ncbi:MAG: serine hydrolase, partial [Microcoleaceae cyanobacterium]